MKYVIFTIILAVLKDSHPLNPEILKYDGFMQDFEATGRRIKEENEDPHMVGTSILKRESKSSKEKNTFTKKDEDEWIDKFGTNEETSGRWRALSQIQDKLSLLQALCTQCHKKAFNVSKVRVTEAFVSEFLLSFSHKKVKPIQATMAMYTYEEKVDPEQDIPYFYFTKSVRPDCVVYIKEKKKEYCLWKEVCGIGLPQEKDSSDESDEYIEPDDVGPFS